MTEFEQLVLSEMQGLKHEVSKVGAIGQDIKTDLATFKVETNLKIEDIATKQKWSTRVYTVLGGAIAVVIAKFTGHS